MRTSVVTFDSRARERLAHLAKQASRHARTDEEAGQVARVCAAVRAGHITVRDGHAALVALRRDQRAAA
jgi:hypothetical protein